MHRLTVSHGGHEPPGNARQAFTILVVRIRIHATDEVVLLVGHDPRTRSLAMEPERLVSVICGLHGTVAVVTGVGLGIAVVKAAARVVMMAVDHPILTFSLVIDSDAVGVILTHTHTRHKEYSIYLMATQGYRSHIRDRKGVKSAESSTDKGTARSLIKMVALA